MDRLIAHPSEKAGLRQSHGADLIDMETSAVALLARERWLRFLAIRVISDDAGAELPAEVARLLTHSSSYRMGVALRAIWHRPSALKDFWKLHARALEAADRLAACIRRAFSRCFRRRDRVQPRTRGGVRDLGRRPRPPDRSVNRVFIRVNDYDYNEDQGGET